MTRTLTPADVPALYLGKGTHRDCTNGQCLIEAYNLIVRQVPDDSCPPGVSPVLHTYGLALNDRLPDAKRQLLKRFLPQPDGTDLLAGTDDGLDEARGYLALDWLIRVHFPTWLDLAGLTTEATKLRELRRVMDLPAVQSAGPVVRAAQDKAAAAAVNATADATATADAACAAAYAAEAAAYAASAAPAAAHIALADAGYDAYAACATAATTYAAGGALRPTVEQLQDSAVNLFGQMLKPGALARLL